MTEEKKQELYRIFYPKVLGYISNRIDNRSEAEDICSDVFVKVYSKIETFDNEKASLSTWIYKITQNTLYDHYRTNHVSDELEENMESSSDFVEDLCNEEELEALAEALKKLPERERDLIILHYYSGNSLKEISEKMNLSYSYIKILHNNALRFLKEHF